MEKLKDFMKIIVDLDCIIGMFNFGDFIFVVKRFDLVGIGCKFK